MRSESQRGRNSTRDFSFILWICKHRLFQTNRIATRPIRVKWIQCLSPRKPRKSESRIRRSFSWQTAICLHLASYHTSSVLTACGSVIPRSRVIVTGSTVLIAGLDGCKVLSTTANMYREHKKAAGLTFQKLVSCLSTRIKMKLQFHWKLWCFRSSWHAQRCWLHHQNFVMEVMHKINTEVIYPTGGIIVRK